MRKMIGVPVGNRNRVARMMYSGYGGNITKYFGDKEMGFQAAKSAVNSALVGRAGPTRYVNQMSRRVYGLNDYEGLGDGASWMDVLKTFVGQVGGGVATKIAGGTKPTIIQAPAAAPFPTWAKVALGVGAAGALYMMIRR